MLRTNAGRGGHGCQNEDTNATLLDQFADVLYTCNLVTHYALHRAGIPSGRVQCVGDLAENVVRRTGQRPTVALRAIWGWLQVSCSVRSALRS